jgi:hypothetical protein
MAARRSVSLEKQPVIPRQAGFTMTRTLTVLAVAVSAALAVAATPASAGAKPHSLGGANFIEVGTTETLDMYASRAATGRPRTVARGIVATKDSDIKSPG